MQEDVEMNQVSVEMLDQANEKETGALTASLNESMSQSGANLNSAKTKALIQSQDISNHMMKD